MGFNGLSAVCLGAVDGLPASCYMSCPWAVCGMSLGRDVYGISVCCLCFLRGLSMRRYLSLWESRGDLSKTLSVDCPRIVCRLFVGCPRAICGLASGCSAYCLWAFMGFHGLSWIVTGLSMGCPWAVRMLSMACPHGVDGMSVGRQETVCELFMGCQLADRGLSEGCPSAVLRVSWITLKTGRGQSSDCLTTVRGLPKDCPRP